MQPNGKGWGWGQKQRSAPLQSRDVGITPTVRRFSVKGTLLLLELSFFCKVTTSKFTAKLHHINTQTWKQEH